MPKLQRIVTNHIHSALNSIHQAIYTVVGTLEMTAWCTKEPVPFARRRSGQKRQLKIGDAWGGLFDCAWFNFRGRVPAAAAGRKVVLLIDLNGEACVFDQAGVPVRGLTNMSSEFWRAAGEPCKRVVEVTARARAAERIDLWADAGCNDLFGNLREGGRIKEAYVAVCDEEMKALYYDYEVLLDFIKNTPDTSARHQQILAALHAAASGIESARPIDVAAARKALAGELAKRGGDPSLTVSAIGHAHIDLGWLWPIRESIRKGARTFSTALTQMKGHKDYVFGASQAQLFAWMKEHYPSLYGKIKQAVAAGRLEPQGCMWVEADMNISGGEALVRQILQGKRFFRREFGVESDYLWLPDCFGYNAALPQLLAKSGCKYFMTQKMSWNRINRFPHNSFHWRGLDGSEVLAHMLPEDHYVSPASPRSLVQIEQKYVDKDVSDRALLLFGIGDGGGGPGEEHLERLSRIGNFAGLPRVQQETAGRFFKDWAKDAERFATWVGELYLERHEGTLTTQARSKWHNRRMEQALREMEWTGVLAKSLAAGRYDALRLGELWRETLLYQFHDILPGSSIRRVYDESLARYREMLAETCEAVDGSLTAIAAKVDTTGLKQPLAAFNSLSWQRTQWLCINGRWLRPAVPSMGYRALDAAAGSAAAIPAVTATAGRLENDVLAVRFNRDGAIVSIYDKAAGREVLAAGARGNRLAVYRDIGDAWDFPTTYADLRPRYMKLTAVSAQVDGPRATLTQTYTLGHSHLTQEIRLIAGSRVLEFATRARWRETNAMLRTRFPVAVLAQEASFDVQFGQVRRPTHRNTTWDMAKDETPAHKWADLSQGDYGVALINDSKYGYKVKDNVLDLNLLRSVRYPGPVLVEDKDVAPGEPHGAYSDQADHVFRYAIYPHAGDAVAGGVIQAAYEFNIPMQVVPTGVHRGSLPPEQSFLAVSSPHVIIEAVKQAEDEDAVILRLYEAAGSGAETELTLHLPCSALAEVDLMEEHPRPVRLRGATAHLTFKPFEIKTIKAIKSSSETLEGN